ncbi:MAG TPA: HlyD family type I secretion periplasmic adaptor subunit [Candidatus Gastranaerophilales bacterium]|nr:HlyD family type I secretion periplasmic adaptor subunit [Candidatus Gastranaerophilales bacterium]
MQKIKNIIKKLFKRDDDSHEFKPLLVEIVDEPVSPLGRSMFWIIIGAMVFTVFWLIFGEIDIVITARGKIIPTGQVKIIQSIDSGVINALKVQEGDYVKQGEILMEIDPSITESAAEAVGKNLTTLRLEEERIKSMIAGKPFMPDSTKYSPIEIEMQQSIYRSAIQNHNDELSTKKENFNLIKEQMQSLQVQREKTSEILDSGLDKQQRLEKVLDIIPKSNYEDSVNDNHSYTAKKMELEHKIEELKIQKKQTQQEISYITSRFKNNLLEQLTETQKKITDLDASFKQREFVNKKQAIKSPVNGYVNKIIMNTIGGVVKPAQELISIVPENEPLVVSAKVLNKDIGFVEKDMPVSVKIDTFSFQKYGIIDGKVIVVGRDSIEDEEMGLVYEVKIEPLQKFLKVDGEEKAIEPGMSLVAEIKTGKRRIIEFFIYPLIKYYQEGISVR